MTPDLWMHMYPGCLVEKPVGSVVERTRADIHGSVVWLPGRRQWVGSEQRPLLVPLHGPRQLTLP